MGCGNATFPRTFVGFIVGAMGASLHHLSLSQVFIITVIDWLVQDRRNSSVNALELRFSCTNPSI